jgi:hypothetical protein
VVNALLHLVNFFIIHSSSPFKKTGALRTAAPPCGLFSRGDLSNQSKRVAQLKEGAQVKVGFRHATTTYGDRIYNELRMNSFEVLRKKEAEPEPIKFVEQTEAIQPTPEEDDLPF